MDKKDNITEESTSVKLAKAAFMNLQNNISTSNPWSADDIDKLEAPDLDEYKEAVKACKFFYRRDPLAASIINKMVDIGISKIFYKKSKLSANEDKIVQSLIKPFTEYAESMALEYLTAGLLVPVVDFERVTEKYLKDIGVKKISTLELPTSMWLRDPQTIVINTTYIMNEPSYYVKVPDDLFFFIMNEGVYPDGTEDRDLYKQMVKLYGAFVTKVRNGEKLILIEDDEYIVRRRPLTDSAYPLPYLYPAVEAMKHKRNMRRMDYSIASRVISAIQLIKMGNDEYPITEADEEQFDEIKNQMYWRYSSGTNIERIFQLFTNHTVTIEWVFPDSDVLLDDKKYKDINKDIFYALGFPGILVTGEAEKTGATDAEYAMLSPIKTIENFRDKILIPLKKIISEVLQSYILNQSICTAINTY